MLKNNDKKFKALQASEGVGNTLLTSPYIEEVTIINEFAGVGNRMQLY